MKGYNNNSGFTMLELLMVVIVVGVLATLAIPQYETFVERARVTEASNYLGSIGNAEIMYYLENDTFAKVLSNSTHFPNTLTIDISNLWIGADDSEYWKYIILNPSGSLDDDVYVIAVRTAKDNPPPQYFDHNIALRVNKSGKRTWVAQTILGILPHPLGPKT